MKRVYKCRWKVFVSLPFWKTCSNSEWEYVFLGFTYSYSAESRSLILTRRFDFVGNDKRLKIIDKTIKDNGDKE